jgi:hypothetical protein
LNCWGHSTPSREKQSFAFGKEVVKISWNTLIHTSLSTSEEESITKWVGRLPNPICYKHSSGKKKRRANVKVWNVLKFVASR